MSDQLTEYTRKAAEEIAGEFYPKLRSLAGCNSACENCETKAACEAAEEATTATMAAIIDRRMREYLINWRISLSGEFAANGVYLEKTIRAIFKEFAP